MAEEYSGPRIKDGDVAELGAGPLDGARSGARSGRPRTRSATGCSRWSGCAWTTGCSGRSARCRAAANSWAGSFPHPRWTNADATGRHDPGERCSSRTTARGGRRRLRLQQLLEFVKLQQFLQQRQRQRCGRRAERGSSVKEDVDVDKFSEEGKFNFRRSLIMIHKWWRESFVHVWFHDK